MLKKITSLGLATIFTVAMGTTQAAPVELTADQMDNVSAGWYYHYQSAYATAGSHALSVGDRTVSRTSTYTVADSDLGVSISGSNSSASAGTTVMYYY